MFVRKSKIATVIKKERQKERVTCEKNYDQKFVKLQKKLDTKQKTSINNIKQEHKIEMLQKEKDIRQLKKEIELNQIKYREIRKREKHLENLTFEVEDVVDSMVIKVQESLQPFYRTRSKVETIMRKSNREHDKVESIFRAVK